MKLKDLLDFNLFKDKRRKIELSNSVDLDLVSYSLYLSVIVDQRTYNLKKMLIDRDYGKNIFITKFSDSGLI